MRARRALAVGAAIGSAAGAVLLRRRAGRSRDRVELYFDDGTTLSLDEGSPEASTVLPLARRILAAAAAS